MLAKLLIHPNFEVIEQSVIEILQQHQISRQSPDILWFDADSKLGVDQAKLITAHYSLKPFQEQGRIAVLINGGNLSDTAQNALLKTIEELPSSSQLIIGAEQAEKLLPTLLSRLEIIRLDNQSTGKATSQHINQFNTGSVSERFKLIEKTDNKAALLNELADYYQQLLKSQPNTLDSAKAVLKAKEWLEQNGNARAILEWLALEIPVKALGED